MIPDSLFSPSQSPCFVLLKVHVSHPQSPVPVLSESSFLLSKSSPLLLQVPFPSSPSPVPILSESRSRPLRPLKVLSHPPPPSKENSGTTRSRPAVIVVVSSKMEYIRFGRSA